MIKVNGTAVHFFKSGADTDPCMQLKLQSTGTTTDPNRALQFPNSLPSETKALTVTSDGVMANDLGEAASGDFEQESEGVGIQSAPTRCRPRRKRSTPGSSAISWTTAGRDRVLRGQHHHQRHVEWTRPTIYHLGLLDTPCPTSRGSPSRSTRTTGRRRRDGRVGSVSAAPGPPTWPNRHPFTGTAVAAGDSVTLTSAALTGTADASGTALTGPAQPSSPSWP